MNTIIETKETFFNRLNPMLAPTELSKIHGAYIMAKFGHRHDVRKEIDEHGDHVRYFEHCKRTAIILIDEAKVRDVNVICAGLLHDTLEDTQDITPDIIELFFGTRTCQIVKLLSKVPKEGYINRLQYYGDYDTILVKAADRLDNMRHLVECEPSFVEKQLEEFANKMLPLFRSRSGVGLEILCDQMMKTIWNIREDKK